MNFFIFLCVTCFYGRVDFSHSPISFPKLANYFAFACSQVWLPTVQDVLHADWHDVWHSPHPPFFTVFCNLNEESVLMCFMTVPSLPILERRQDIYLV